LLPGGNILLNKTLIHHTILVIIPLVTVTVCPSALLKVPVAPLAILALLKLGF
jgi:hypothetical protein